MVVLFADASTQPHAVVVVFENAVVAYMAVGGSRGSEDSTHLAIFEFEQLVATCVNAVIKYLVVSIGISIFTGKFMFTADPRSSWDNSWIGNS